MITNLLANYLLQSMFSTGSAASIWEVVFSGNTPSTLKPNSTVSDLVLFPGCAWKTLIGDWVYNAGVLDSGEVVATLPYFSHEPPLAWDNSDSDSSDAEEWQLTYLCVAATVGGVRRLVWFQELEEVVVVPIGDSLEITNDLEIEIGGI